MIKNQKEIAYRHLRRKLENGLLAAGTQLVEVELAKEIGISRTPVREAISLLGSEGLVTQVPRYGAFVAKPTAKELRNLWDLRRVLEIHAALSAMDRLTASDFRKLFGLCDRQLQLIRAFRDGGCVGSSHRAEFSELDLELHLTIYRAADNDQLVKIVSDSRIISQLVNEEWVCDQILRNHSYVWRDHLRLVRALYRKDKERVREVLDRHLVGSVYRDHDETA